MVTEVLLEKLEEKYGKTEKIPIRFKGHDFLLIGNTEHGGAIATKEQYENFEESFAHLHRGQVLRYGIIIGSTEDIEIVKNIKED